MLVSGSAGAVCSWRGCRRRGALVSLVAVSLELLSDELLALEESCSAGLGSAGADGRVSATGLVGLGVAEAWLGAVGGGGPGIVEVVVGTWLVSAPHCWAKVAAVDANLSPKNVCNSAS